MAADTSDDSAPIIGSYIGHRLNRKDLPQMITIPVKSHGSYWIKLIHVVVSIMPNEKFTASFIYHRRALRPGDDTPWKNPGDPLTHVVRGKYILTDGVIIFKPYDFGRMKLPRTIRAMFDGDTMVMGYEYTLDRQAYRYTIEFSRHGGWRMGEQRASM